MAVSCVLVLLLVSVFCWGSDAYRLHRIAKRGAHFQTGAWHGYSFNAPNSPGFEPVTDYGMPRSAGIAVFSPPANAPVLQRVPSGTNIIVTNEVPQPTNAAAVNNRNAASTSDTQNMLPPADSATAPPTPSNPSNVAGPAATSSTGTQTRPVNMAAPNQQPVARGVSSTMIVNRGEPFQIISQAPGYGAPAFAPAGAVFAHHHFQGAAPNHHHHGGSNTVVQVPTFFPVPAVAPAVQQPASQPLVIVVPSPAVPQPIPQEPAQEVTLPPTDPRVPGRDDTLTRILALANAGGTGTVQAGGSDETGAAAGGSSD